MGNFADRKKRWAYEDEWCVRCIHGGDDERPCAVMEMHVLETYVEGAGKPESPLHMLIPVSQSGENLECLMFREVDDEAEVLRW